MSYTIQSIIAPNGAFPDILPSGLVSVRLDQGMQMIPLSTEVRRRYSIPFCPLTDDGCTELPTSIADLCARLYKESAMIYIEAEIFGDIGIQASVLIKNGSLIYPCVVSESAINAGLRQLGVSAVSGHDEFELVGLNRFRDTDAWLSNKID